MFLGHPILLAPPKQNARFDRKGGRYVFIGQIESRARMATIKNGGKTTTRRQRSDHAPMHLIINNHPRLFKIHGINRLIHPILLIPISIFRLASMATIMKEQIVVRLRARNKPVHGTEDIGSSGLSTGIFLVVCEDDHVVPGKMIAFMHELRHVFDVVDTAFQLLCCAKVIDPN